MPVTAALIHRWEVLSSASLLWRQQKYPSWSRMNVAICSNFLMFTDIGVLQTESDNLPFLIDGKSANKHCIARQVSNRFIQVEQSIFGGPQKGPCTERGGLFTHYLAGIIDVKGFAVYSVRS